MAMINRFSIILPAHNEAANLYALLGKLTAQFPDVERWRVIYQQSDRGAKQKGSWSNEN